MLRIVAGEFGGRRIASPPGVAVRPTSEMARGALFSSLGDEVKGAAFADLFSGTGAVGIEALSRGAAFVAFVDVSRERCAAIMGALRILGAGGRAVVACVDAMDPKALREALERALAARSGARGFEPRLKIAFADPPYAMPGVASVPSIIAALGFGSQGLLCDGATVVVEHSARLSMPDDAEGLVRIRLRRYGEAALSVYRCVKKPGGADAPPTRAAEGADMGKGGYGGVFIYPGSFDPATCGHLDIIARASKMCSELIVAVGRNREKRTLFDVSERVGLLREAVRDASDPMPNVRVTSFEGLLADYARACGASVIVKGLRAISDFEAEFQMALTNKYLDDTLETIFLMTSVQYTYLSSSNVKELAMNGASLVGLVPACVGEALLGKVAGAVGRGSSGEA